MQSLHWCARFIYHEYTHAQTLSWVFFCCKYQGYTMACLPLWLRRLCALQALG